MSNMLRITGMATGMDTDSTIKQLMKPYNMRLDKMKQDKQVVQWKQDLYREIIGDINTLKSTYFDNLLNPSTSILNKNNYSILDASTDTQNAVSLTAGAGAVAGNYSVKVDNLAESAVLGGGATGISSSSTKLSDLGITDGTLELTVNGSATPISVAVDSTKTVSDLISSINSASGGTAVARYSELTKTFTIKTAQTGSTSSLAIGSSDAGFLNNFKTALGIAADTDSGVDAQVKITPPGGAETTVTKSTNNFSIDGVTYSLTNTNAAASTISLTLNTQKAVDKIKTFVGKYNELLDKIQTKIEQKKSGYSPLTDDQKSSMKSEEITKWEDKAKEGILRNDDLLSKFTQDLRNTLYQTVQGAGIALTDSMGFGTTEDTTKRGQISIDETKLKAALQNNGDQIMNLFCKTSESQPTYNRAMTSSEKQTRISEEGIFQRIKDVLEDYTSTMYRDSNGKKGTLIERAGIKGDLSEIKNLYYEDLVARNTRITDMERKISDKENQYYNQFAKLESAMNQMNSQQSWLSSQLGGR